MKNQREIQNNQTDIKIIITKARRNYLVPDPNYHTTNFFSDNLLVIEMKKTNKHKSVYLALSVLELGKIVTHEFRYDCVTPKYGENAKFCYIDTDSFIVYKKYRRQLRRYCRRC